MEELSKTSTVHLIGLWIDLNRPQTQWSVEGRPGEWQLSVGYKSCRENIEATISKKLQLTLLETRILLNCKKTCQDAQENSFFNPKKRKEQEHKKRTKYLSKLASGMGEINQLIFEAHHAVCKLEGLNEELNNYFKRKS